MRIKSLVSLSVLTIALATGAAQAQETLKIGTEGAYPPFNYVESNGQLGGFDVDIAKALCEEMNVTCEFVQQDWDGIIPALQAKRFDAVVASMSITDERKQQVDFTNPYYTNSLVFVAPKDGEFDPANPGDASIGVQGGTIAETYAQDTYKEATVSPYPTQVEAWTDLQNGRLDAVLGDFGVQQGFVDGDGKDCCEFKGESVAGGDKIGIAVRKGETELAEKLNSAIKAIRENGKYKEINDKYFKIDVYGE
ncbi:ABC transporter substrate-binding protein [Limoniibacter endophyticus]|uniref:ABC transporter substrate-binding protein n=1 Tax=Limoniibacter endophyticus TaxID=1565040 RepID=UPI001675DD00|nr:ABC transporter substrate-binding protein [Limoniibacter endophyticus]